MLGRRSLQMSSYEEQFEELVQKQMGEMTRLDALEAAISLFNRVKQTSNDFHEKAMWEARRRLLILIKKGLEHDDLVEANVSPLRPNHWPKV
jgi:hypothetical protein